MSYLNDRGTKGSDNLGMILKNMVKRVMRSVPEPVSYKERGLHPFESRDMAGGDYGLDDFTNKGSSGGHGYTFSEAVSAALSGATTVIQVNVPTNCILIGCQLRVDTAVTGATSWTAAYSGGATQACGAGAGANAQNTKTSTWFDVNAATNITSAETDITVTAVGPNFSGGVIRAIVYYQTFTAMVDV